MSEEMGLYFFCNTMTGHVILLSEVEAPRRKQRGASIIFNIIPYSRLTTSRNSLFSNYNPALYRIFGLLA